MLAAAIASIALGQEFEVVSVKPNTSESTSTHSHSDQGMLTATNLSLRNLIATAYQVRDYQIAGPDWLGSQHFDIAAKFPQALPEDGKQYDAAFSAMMRKMLLDRFKLAVHREQKTMPVYGLVVGKSGIKFKESPDGGSRSHSTRNHYEGTPVDMHTFADFLGRRMDLPVVDMTGLQGSYTLTLDWVPEARPAGDGKSGVQVFADPPSGPALTDAVQEQLGLKLETRKAPIEILVVDHAERVPTEN